jgi:hypothetical protein
MLVSDLRMQTLKGTELMYSARVPYVPNLIRSYYDFDFLSYLGSMMYLGVFGLDALNARILFAGPYLSPSEQELNN